MGKVERIGSHLVGSKVALMADTGVVFIGCRVMLKLESRPNVCATEVVGIVNNHKEIATKFKGYIGGLVYRASKVNIEDMLEAQVRLREGMLN